MHGTLTQSLKLERRVPSRPKPGKTGREKVVNLALQGGGSHGAFTWGVLDRLLEEKRLTIEGITATSAGAVNAVLVAHGLATGGNEEARSALRNFWQRISAAASHGVFQPSLIDKMNGNFGLEHSPGYLLMGALSCFASPYQLNPFDYNPLKNLLEEIVDFARLREQPVVKLFLCATNARTGKPKIFKGDELQLDHVLASACLPLLTRAVEIDGEHFWDGGFAGNPAIFPVIYRCEAPDVIMVHLTPTERPDLPTTSYEIINRMQEISLNSSFMGEMRSLALITKLIDDGRVAGGKRMLMHLIDAEDVIREFPGSSRLNCDWDFLLHLHDIGRQRADQWLASNFDNLGVRSTVDLRAKYF
jgi:NTE family protein